MNKLALPSTLTLNPVEFDPFEGGELLMAVPATESQQEIWLGAQMGDEANLAYNESLSLRLHGLLAVDALRSALQTLVQRHEALRSNFSGDGTALCVPATRTIEIPLIDLSVMENADDRAAKLQQLIRLEAAEHSFNLAHDSLFRAQLVRLSLQEHVLILTGHHIVCDGWSWGVLLPELAALYSAAQVGKPADLEPPQKFSDYALLQADLPTTQEYAEAEKYWLQQLSGQVPVLELPLDKPRPSFRTYTSDREDWALPAALITDLKKTAAKAGCSFFTLLLTAFEVFLHRLSGQTDIIVGVPSAGQSFTEFDQVVGHCVNFLPIRSQIDPSQPFVDYMRARSPHILEAYDYQQLGFGALIKKLSLPRDTSRVPLAPVSFNLDRPSASTDFSWHGLELEIFSNAKGFSSFEIFMNLSETNGGITLECEYNTDLFEQTTIQRWLQSYEVLLTGIVANPTQFIRQLPLLGKTEQTLLQQWNTTQTNYPADQCIHQLFEAQVEQTPEAIAVVFEQQHLTYQQLNEKANQLAHYLRTLGVVPDMLVGLCMERSLDMIIALLAILKAGGAYVPFDSSYPQERLAFMLEDTQVEILLTQAPLLGGLPPHTARTICLDTDWETIAHQPTTNPVNQTNPDHLAYINYTSGSTGRPKGVCVPHRGVVRLVKNTNYASLTAEEVFLQLAPISFDAATLEIWGALLNGARLVVMPIKTPSLAELGQVVRNYQVTILWLTAGLFHLMVDEQLDDLRSVRQLLAGGDVLSVPHVKKVLETFPHCTLINGYGPTENTTFTCCYPMTTVSQVGDSVSIGRPIANTQIYVLDKNLQTVPIGVPGELYAGGDGLARGYLNRPELTTERFIPNPFGQGRLYKTGDLVRYQPDGTLEFLGRVDNQVKIRGFRIELGEIEALLATHPHVQSVVVIVRQDQPGDKRLVAYVILHPGQTTTTEELLSFLRDKLPNYMVPAAIVLMKAFPLNPNGKVDRKALPTPDFNQHQTLIAPRNQLELQLAKIWQRSLGLTAIGVTDNFFEIGGHSMLAIQLMAEVEKVFKKTLPLSTIFQANTIERMAHVLDQSDWKPPCPAMVIVQPGGHRTPLFGIHVLGRGLEFYRPLTKALHPDQPLYGLSVQIMDKDLAPPNEVKDLAAYYIQEMRTIQPEGPYLLSGVSFGGVVAYEMAQQLHQQGQRVALLALLDTYPTIDTDPRSLKERTTQNLTLLRQKRFDILFNKAKQKLQGTMEKFEDKIYQRRLQKALKLGHSVEDDVRLQALYYGELNDQAMAGYNLQPYPGKITLFRCTDVPLDDHVDLEAEWKKLTTEGIETYTVPGDHLGMLRIPENAEILGEFLQSCIDKAILQK